MNLEQNNTGRTAHFESGWKVAQNIDWRTMDLRPAYVVTPDGRVWSEDDPAIPDDVAALCALWLLDHKL